MRSGATQASPTANPDVSITIDGTDTYSSVDGWETARLLTAKCQELVYGGEYLFEIDNSDSSLSAKNYKGSLVICNFGFIGTSGSNLHTLTVDEQKFISKNGKLILQLHCIDHWSRLSFYSATLGGSLWNHPSQSLTALAEVTLPNGEDLPAALITAINAQYDITIETIIYNILFNTLGCLATPEPSHSDTAYYATKPIIQGSDARSVVAQAMENSKSYLRLKTNAFQVVCPTNGSVAYSYNVSNLFFQNIDSSALVRPNTIVYHGAVWDTDHYDLVSTASGHGEDATSIAKIGIVAEHNYYDWRDITNLSSQALVNSMADTKIANLQAALTMGTLVAPMHCSQEMFDKITIIDDRYDSPRTTTGYVFGILREYDRGIYRITLTLGGESTFYTPPGGKELRVTPFIPTAYSANVPASSTIGAYIADVKFTSVDYNHISWTAGTVKLADGRTQAINSGTLTLTTTHYLYCILGNSTLQNTTTATNAIGSDRMLVGVASIATTAAQKAYVNNPWNDSILINTDKVMDGLVTELKIASEAVTNSKIHDISAVKINAGYLSADRIAAGSISALKLSISTLDALSANCGTLTSGTINGVTIYAGSGAVLLDSSGIHITGQFISFIYGTDDDNFIWATSLGLYIQSGASDLNLSVLDSSKFIRAHTNIIGSLADLNKSLGTSAYPWGRVYANLKIKLPVGTNMYTDP